MQTVFIRDYSIISITIQRCQKYIQTQLFNQMCFHNLIYMHTVPICYINYSTIYLFVIHCTSTHLSV